MCEKSFSNPKLIAAVAESPPPITVYAPSNEAIFLQIAIVPEA
jgi:hypothetical protein